MVSNWPVLPLGEIVKVKGGKRLPKGSALQSEKSEHPYIRVRDMGTRYIPTDILEYVPNDIFPSIKNYIVEENDVIISIVGTIGLISIIDKPLHLASQTENCAKLSGLDSSDAHYLYYYLNSYVGQQQIKEATVGAVQAKLPLYGLNSLSVIWPERHIREKIVHNLISLDDKIELNRQTNQTLEQMAQTLFKSWFVDFDPVFDNLLAKADFKLENLANDFPEALLKRAQKRLLALDDKAKTALLSASLSSEVKSPVETSSEVAPQTNIHQHFPSEFEHNEQQGWIPKGWTVSTTDDEFVVKGGSTPSTKNPDFWDDGDIHWTSPKDLSGNDTKVMLDTSRKITRQGLKKITSGLLPVDTVLMSSRAPVGYLALAKIPVAINQGYIAITSAKTLSSEYTIQWLDSVMDEIKTISGGTTFAEISKKTFKSIQIIIPIKEAVNAYTEFAKASYQRITANVQEINTLTETRDYLLPKLISGELTIPTEIKGDV